MQRRKNEETIQFQPAKIEGDIIKAGIKEKLVDVSTQYLSEKISLIIELASKNVHKTLTTMKKDDNVIPDKAAVEFGISLDMRGEIFIAQAAANSSMKISLEWRTRR